MTCSLIFLENTRLVQDQTTTGALGARQDQVRQPRSRRGLTDVESLAKVQFYSSGQHIILQTP